MKYEVYAWNLSASYTLTVHAENEDQAIKKAKWKLAAKPGEFQYQVTEE